MADPVTTATAAMRHWTAGAASGDWSRLIAMFDPDVTFHVPVPGFEGIQRGAGAATRFFDHLTAVLRADLEVTSTLCGAEWVAFEVTVRGTMHDRAFRQALCLVFETGGGRVLAFREYLAWPGGLDPID
jgi:ketosteroid isomerase-like protein